MTEKRFTVDKDGRTILDSIDDSYCECVESYEAKQYCDKLNELAEEKQQLINDCGILVQSNQDYRKENEQLKKEILWWKYRCGEDISGDV